MRRLSTYYFTWIRTINTNWAKQKSIKYEKWIKMSTCLFHYNMDVVGPLIRYLGNDYTRAYRGVGATAKQNHHYPPCGLVCAQGALIWPSYGTVDCFAGKFVTGN